TFDTDQIRPERFHGVVRQPVVESLEGFLASEYLHPCDLALAAVGFLDGGVEDADAGTPDVGAGAVALDERDNRPVGHLKFATGEADRLAFGRGCYVFKL